MLKPRLSLLLLIVAAALAACSTAPLGDSPLEQARASELEAQEEAQAANLAAGELGEADDALRKADRLWLDASMAEADAARRSAASSKAAADSELLASAASRRQADADARARDREAQLKDLDMRKTERGLVITLGDVLFDAHKAGLKESGLRSVQKLAGMLKEYPRRRVLIEGFTDSTGTSAYNQDLSDQRAMAVRTALQVTGVGPERIADRGYGQTFPVATNATAEGRQLNRRVEIIVSEDGKRIPPR